MLICGDGVYPRVQPATAEQTSRQQIISSPGAPSIVHQMVSMAWLMLMQMQQLVSGFSVSSQRSSYFLLFLYLFLFVCFCLVSHARRRWKKWDRPRRFRLISINSNFWGVKKIDLALKSPPGIKLSKFNFSNVNVFMIA